MFRILGLLIAALFVIGFIAVIVLAGRVKRLPPHVWFTRNDRFLVIAHQGGDGERPSNTMTAFRHAVDLGVDVLEMDIHSTSDGVLVVIHDATIDRTTDGSGRVQDYTFADLQAFDAAYHWPTLDDEEGRPTDEFPYRGQGVTIPSLEEVLRAFPQMPMVIEIKQREPSIVQPLCNLLRATNMTEQVVIVSFDGATMRAFRAACPEVATAAAQDEVTPFVLLNLFGLSSVYQPVAHALQVPEQASGLRVVSAQSVAAAHALGMDVQVWTVNESDDMRRMIAAGVDGIMTDYPSRLLEVVGR
jgi:glycerophosphoryl diester phosphodiesterase